MLESHSKLKSLTWAALRTGYGALLIAKDTDEVPATLGVSTSKSYYFDNMTNVGIYFRTLVKLHLVLLNPINLPTQLIL